MKARLLALVMIAVVAIGFKALVNANIFDAIAARDAAQIAAQATKDNVNKYDEDQGSTPMGVAVLSGNVDVVKALVAAGADAGGRIYPNEKDALDTPMSVALTNGFDDIYNYFTSINVKVDALSQSILAQPRLYRAAIAGNKEGLNAVLADYKAKGTSLDEKGPNGRTPLAGAIFESQMDAAQVLLDAGSNVNGLGAGSDTPVYCAAIRGEDEFMQKLIDKGADVNAAGTDGTTPLEAVASAITGSD